MFTLQCSSLLDPSECEQFIEEKAEEYDEIREDHYENLKVCSLSIVWHNYYWHFLYINYAMAGPNEPG